MLGLLIQKPVQNSRFVKYPELQNFQVQIFKDLEVKMQNTQDIIIKTRIFLWLNIIIK